MGEDALEPDQPPTGWRAYTAQITVLVLALLVIAGLRFLRDDGGDPRLVDSGDGQEQVDDEPADLDDVVLRLDDLPSGWATTAEPPDGAGEGLLACAAGDAGSPTRASKVVRFRLGSDGPAIANVVTDHGSVAAAREAFAAARTSLQACIEEDPQPGEPDLRPALLTLSTADETAAAGLTADVGGLTVTGELYHVRVGSRVATVVTLARVEEDPRLGRPAITAVAARL